MKSDDKLVYRLAESKCGLCGHRMNACAAIGKEFHKPTAGDVTLCIECGSIHVFIDAGKVRLATKEEREKLYVEIPNLRPISDRLAVQYYRLKSLGRAKGLLDA